MVKLDGYSSFAASRRRIRTHAEWNVDTHIFWATGPTRAATRCFISSAALLVKVMARIWKGETPSRISQAMRWVSTRVLPEPAPATISSGPSVWVTASRWTGFSPESRSSSKPSSSPFPLVVEVWINAIAHVTLPTGRIPYEDTWGAGGSHGGGSESNRNRNRRGGGRSAGLVAPGRGRHRGPGGDQRHRGAAGVH